MTIFNDGIELHSMVGRSVVRDGIVNRFELVVSWWAFNLTFYRDNVITNNIVVAVIISFIRCGTAHFIVHWKNPCIVGFNWIHDFPVLLFFALQLYFVSRSAFLFSFICCCRCCCGMSNRYLKWVSQFVTDFKSKIFWCANFVLMTGGLNLSMLCSLFVDAMQKSRWKLNVFAKSEK